MIFQCNLSSKLILIIIVIAIIAIGGQVGAQQPTREELKRLQRQMDDLKESQNAIHKELQEIKTLLQGRQGPPNVPPQPTKVSTDDDPIKGDKNAKLTLIEFSDYQCPFCGRFFAEALPRIEKEYISTGKLRYVFRDFPIESIHRDAFKAHEAANCAGEHGKYWEMHDRLFQNQNQLGVQELPKHAEAIGVNLSSFQTCLNSGKYGSEIRKDMEDGIRAGVNGTPTFFLGIQDSEDQIIKVLKTFVGAQPYEQFKIAIEEALRELKN